MGRWGDGGMGSELKGRSLLEQSLVIGHWEEGLVLSY
jgi:hypothetical protein